MTKCTRVVVPRLDSVESIHCTVTSSLTSCLWVRTPTFERRSPAVRPGVEVDRGSDGCGRGFRLGSDEGRGKVSHRSDKIDV